MFRQSSDRHLIVPAFFADPANGFQPAYKYQHSCYQQTTKPAYNASSIIVFCFLSGIQAIARLLAHYRPSKYHMYLSNWHTTMPGLYSAGIYRTGIVPNWHCSEPALYRTGIVLNRHCSEPALYRTSIVLSQHCSKPALFRTGIVPSTHCTEPACYVSGIILF